MYLLFCCLVTLNEAFVIRALRNLGVAGVIATLTPTGPSPGLPEGFTSNECLMALVVWKRGSKHQKLLKQAYFLDQF